MSATPGAQPIDELVASPLRVTLLRLLAAAGEPMTESALARDAALLIEGVRASLEPLMRAGLARRVDGGDELAWRLEPARAEGLAPALERAAREHATLFASLGLALEDPFRELVGRSPAMLRLRQQLRAAGRTRLPVVVRGEPGSGKEAVALALHRLSAVADKPFAAMPTDVIPPIVGAPFAGTLFVSELGALAPSAQAELVRVLEDEATNEPGRPSALRLVAATAFDPAELVSQGRLRPELRHRVDAVSIMVPPLRERGEDIPLLAARFLALATWRYGVLASPGFEVAALRRLAAEHWPRNVRELEHTIYRAALLARGAPLSEAMVSCALAAPGEATRRTPSEPRRRPAAITRRTRRLDEVVREMVLRAMAAYNGNLSAAARALGISRVTLYRKLGELGVAVGQERDAVDVEGEDA